LRLLHLVHAEGTLIGAEYAASAPKSAAPSATSAPSAAASRSGCAASTIVGCAGAARLCEAHQHVRPKWQKWQSWHEGRRGPSKRGFYRVADPSHALRPQSRSVGGLPRALAPPKSRSVGAALPALV
jgi:hypothetical protein